MRKRWTPSSIGMVGWFEPGQLLKTGLDVMFSTTLGRHADNRRAQGLSPEPRPFLDYSTDEFRNQDGSFWFDYVADCGDGGNPTYMVASAVASPECLGLPRGRLLVFGGDCVYPSAGSLEYDMRLVAPYRAAMPHAPNPAVHVLAIPGNHDWYDSLSSFIRLFCSGEPFAGWRTTQTRSYFAAKLPAGWWLLGVDVQLSHDIDLLQLRSFLELARHLGPNDRVILCCPEPFWVAEQRDRMSPMRLSKTNLHKLVDALGEHLVVSIAGDLHHYRRHSKPEGFHRITCGTGGAFLHPTHDNLPEVLNGYKRETTFPAPETSAWLAWINLGFFFRNLKFGALTGLLYLMIAWGLGVSMGESFASGVSIEEVATLPITEPLRIAKGIAHAALLNEVSMGFVLAMVLSFVAFSDHRYKRFRWISGILHTFFHLSAAILIYWVATRISLGWPFEFQAKSIEQYLLSGAIILPAGWLLGSLIMGVYLWISLNVFGQHSNEAFSALRIQDWKGFLRLKIARDGALDLHFIGIRKVPRKWKRSTDTAGPQWLPADGRGECVIVDKVSVSAQKKPEAQGQNA